MADATPTGRTADVNIKSLETTPPPEPTQHPFTMRDLLEKMFRGWILLEQSYVERVGGGTYTRTQEDCMVEACNNNVLEGHLLTLFGHWSNDVISLAAHYGLALARRQPDDTLLHDDGTVDTLLKGGKLEIVYIDPAPTPEHYWYKGQWNAPDPDGKDFAVFHVAGDS